MKKALITGITGQDGSYLAEILLGKGYEVHGLMRRTSSPNLGNIKHLRGNPKFKIHDGDMGDTICLYKLVKEIMPDEIYNFAAMAGVSPSFSQPEYCFEIGALAVVRLLEVIKQIKPDIKFLQATSSHIFGNIKTYPQTEVSPISPISPYGLAKTSAHHAVNYYRSSHGMFTCSAIFYAHASPRYSESFLLSKVVHGIRKILKGEQKILEVGNIDNPLDVGYAKEYVEASYKILQNDKPDDFIIATGELHTPREFITSSFEIAGLDIKKYLKINKSLKRPEVSILQGDYSKAKRVLGWQPKVKFKELIKIMVKADVEQLKKHV
ncbi:MAG: GDP-mannose 4,6-dehydratase [bacterium]|nr:GDP-mannose 4,6-dehydratase [bacterium]